MELDEKGLSPTRSKIICCKDFCLLTSLQIHDQCHSDIQRLLVWIDTTLEKNKW